MKSELRPAEGWVFLEPISEDRGIIKVISIGMDSCDIDKWVEYHEPKPIALPHLGFIAVKNENIMRKGSYVE